MKKIVLAVIVLSLVVVFSDTVIAQNWVCQGTFAGSKLYFDTNSFEKNGRMVSFRERFDIKDSTVSYIHKRLINCETRETKRVRVWMYMGDEDMLVDMGPGDDGWKKCSGIYDSVAKRYCK